MQPADLERQAVGWGGDRAVSSISDPASRLGSIKTEMDVPVTALDRQKPQLFLLAPDFEDAAYPAQRFFCRHSALVEGVVASFPLLEDVLNIRRIGFSRPRAEIVALIGEAHQALPVLILPPGESFGHASGEAGGRQFVTGAEPIIAALVERGVIPPPHP